MHMAVAMAVTVVVIVFAHGSFAYPRVRCVPSQSGWEPVFLQTQNQSFFDSAGTYFSGENSLPLCEPSQNGCVALRPQRHHQ